MSYLSNFHSGGDGGGGDDDDEDEMAVDASYLLPPVPNDIFIDINSTTTLATINSLSSQGYSDGAIIQDPLADLGAGDILELQTPASTLTVPFAPQQKESETKPAVAVNPPINNLQDTPVFKMDLIKNIEEIINESIQLLNKDPREYHPFYLRVFKYITIGQHQGHIPKGAKEATKIWKKYDQMAAKMYEDHKTNPKPFTCDKSPYAVYILTKQLFLNGKLVTEKRDEVGRNKQLKDFERFGRKILKDSVDYASPTFNVRNNLGLRLKFFHNCYSMAHPADCIQMNELWGRFCSDFGREPPLPIVDPPSKKKIIVKFNVKSPVEAVPIPLPEDDHPPSPLPSPLPMETEEVEQKYEIPVESVTTEVPATKKEPEKKTVKKKNKRIVLINSSELGAATTTPENMKSSSSLANNSKEKTGKKLKINKKLMRSKMIRFRLARKKLKVGLKQVSMSSSQKDKVLSSLEKKISGITQKLTAKPAPVGIKTNKPTPLESVVTRPAALASQLFPPAPEPEKSSIPEFSMCEDCGQTYRTHYLNIHKEAVHNPDNLGKQCPLCPQFFKGTHYLWSHFLGSHMPDHLNPGKLAFEVVPIVENSQDLESTDEPQTEKNPEPQDTSWNCPHCENKPFATKGTLQRHLHLVHGEGNLPESKLTCSECPKTFKEKAALTQHVKLCHQGIENRCTVCQKRFQTPGKLWKHQVDDHGIVNEFPSSNLTSVQCEYCGENCLQGKQYINHVRISHPDNLEQVLKQEKERRKEKVKENKRKANLKKKLSGIKGKSSGPGPKECPICGKTLQNNLSRHLALCHSMGDTQVKTYICPKPECGRKYKSRVSLRVHLSELHDPVKEKLKEKKLIRELLIDSTPAKTYQCALCGWKVGNRHECMVHLVVGHPHCLEDEGDESGHVTIKCPHCEETGRTQDQIRRHLEFVHPEEVWRCPYPNCGMVILSPTDLQEHFYTGHNEKENEDGKNKKVKKKRDRSNWKKGKRKPRADGKHRFRRVRGRFPCYRCENVENSEMGLHRHVKENHKEAYWPCEECNIMCFSERCKMFHQNTLCKVKRKRAKKDDGVVGYDQIPIKCEICKRQVNCSSFTRHLKGNHGIVEDGNLWKCGICEEDEMRQNFKTREYWLSHMDDCHGAEVDMEELIEVAKKINTKEEINLEEVTLGRKVGGRENGKRMAKSKKKALKMARGRKKNSNNGSRSRGGGARSRSGRVIKRKRFESDEESDFDEDFRLESDDDDFVDEVAPKTRAGTRTSKRLCVGGGRRGTRGRPIDSKTTDVEEILSNLPLNIRKMLNKKCSVRLEKLSEEQIKVL